ncbi:3-hydroxyacyl-[acyl-carrier-protein] dehydratase FabZ [Pseudobythopirellula maris]|uniref:3-hydroxyacyl-[acyl-carrier-protein] dehydratase FabZ n=1 Tax=Pseudobythopirellula maris TaxID=2527991 RepID=A0A5C5ZQ53_9BACT|nr:3-hydroxyacyl-ACP dehydratase FabZ family protein [Pseudobythopirellula maris]TWT88941.1 3-hydroxyacyl-[acyl-carrier-protein] dehydratase FabZ [Pseudobythopirellula maris]
MRFWLIDAIESFEPGVGLTASKNVSYSEEYLQDHFPEFPVLPGVFQLEAATQAAAWYLRMAEGHAHSVVTLKEAKNVKYADFVSPGDRLTIRLELVKQDDRDAMFKVTGGVGEKTSLTGRIVVERFNLADTDPSQAEADAHLRKNQREILQAIHPAGVALLSREPAGAS